MFFGLPLNAKDEVCEWTASPSRMERFRIISSVRPSEK
jgi:hypothetical protein